MYTERYLCTLEVKNPYTRRHRILYIWKGGSCTLKQRRSSCTHRLGKRADVGTAAQVIRPNSFLQVESIY